MFRKRYYYLIKLQYLGFRYHGWQKQPNVNTLQRMVERTINYVLETKDFKVLAAGRTDAKVSANEAYVELFVDHNPLVLKDFFELFNQNLPQDIRGISIQETDEYFNIIQHPKIKEYIYLFSYGKKFHPFSAPFMYNVIGDLDIDSMMEAAKLFEGRHNFRSYCHRPNANTILHGEIIQCEIVKNDLYTANFFPDSSYLFRVKGEGFKRNQIRLMMGVLLDLGKGKVDINFIKKTLNPMEEEITLEHIVPGSGLILNTVKLKE
ncbi:tRNA pseudouridine(38-40) synthase TruA [Aquimarina sp. MMG015]|uniref:tRNA pseudouridine(38-40) synthase TruA n=1 Tax=unclassified Aquimarina TaxID=2627091 RepID=UPI000E55764A|nr:MULTISPECIES: tRNA pseudouridine(38-40) synthase TruA [unclassified Aquimarina]AXT55338.1 tRNA pseudouridine(38-40) synthase TruA [Aquimarina sp. AD1]MBQ4802305.1 tRNA pseudouridine(38-40) synthase TruA [Aquimarina sp. MMG015]RKN13840.1 tRNA pseudouridine(38-40) synthase TruA [Aquimarina sp. AD1]